MSRADYELANNVLRDALLEACETIAALAKDKPGAVAEELERYRILAERTRAEDQEDDPPFSEHAREAAWRAWIAAHRRCNFDIKVDRAETEVFREWWWSSTERRRRGELDYNVERLTPEQRERLEERVRAYDGGYTVFDADEDDD